MLSSAVAKINVFLENTATLEALLHRLKANTEGIDSKKTIYL